MAENEKEVREKKPAKKHLLLRILRVFLRALGMLCILLIFLTLGLAGGAWWLCGTDSGHGFLLSMGNRFLDGGEPNGKMRVHLNSLEGALPFSFKASFELLDDRGVFLSAPNNRFALNWRELPRTVNVQTLSVEDLTLLRLPDLPPKPEEQKEEKPLTIEDIKSLAALGAKYIDEPPSWLPMVKVDGISIINAAFPRELLGKSGEEGPNGPDGLDGLDMLRADADLNLDWNRSGLAANAAARLCADAGKNVDLPSFNFEAASVDLKINAPAAPQMLNFNAVIHADIDSPRLEIEKLPPDLTGEKIGLNLSAAVKGKCPEYRTLENLELNLTGPDLSAGRLAAKGASSWQSGPAFAKNELDGPLNLALDVTLANGPAGAPDLLAMLRAPLSLDIKADGEILRPDVALSLSCDNIEAEGHKVENLALSLTGRELALPVSSRQLEEDESRVALSLSGSLDGHKLRCDTGLFYRPEKSSDGGESRDFLAGLRDLDLLAAGVQGRGTVSALIREGKKPAIDGSLNLRVVDWPALSALLPGSAMSGEARVDVDLASGGGDGQKAALEIDVPRFSMLRDKKRLASLKGFGARAKLVDIFEKPAVDAALHLDNVEAAGMKIGAKVAANGPIAGPLRATVESSGSVASNIALSWQPGKAEISALDVKYKLPGKGLVLGAKAARPMQITYGDAGLGLGGIDLAILPAGRLIANGGLAPQKLDLDVKLENLAFKPWRALVSQLPEGTAEVSARLKGTPQRPAGDFRLGVSGVKVPNVPLAPVSLALVGRITPQGGNRGKLEAQLEASPQTIKALGGTTCHVGARIPLLFADNGIPGPDMNAPLGARVVWDGALGPLWNLVPVADMRLNGKIGLNIDASGTMAAPRVKGVAAIDNGRYENVALGVLLTAINLKLNLDDVGIPAKGGLPGSLRVALSASDGRGGTITVNGGGRLAGDNLNIQAKINKLRPLRRRDIHVELSGDARVGGNALAPLIDGKIVVDKGEVLLDNIDMGASSITTLPISTPASEKAAAKKAEQKGANPESGGRLNVRIIMPPRFSVEGRGLTSLWQANLLISGPLDAPSITGTVNCYRGNFDFLGKDFVLTKGIVFFGGGSLSNPLLDIELTNETPDLTAHLFITGPVNKMKLSLTSDPSLPRDDILSKVLFGRSTNELSRLEALQLAGAVAQLAGFTGNGSSIFQMGKKALGLDVLRLGSSSTAKGGEPGDTNASGTTIEAGKYINDWLYMGVEQGMKADSTAFVIQLELTPRSNIEIHTEQSNTWAGYKWKLNY